MNSFDVLIVGAGPAGISCALMLRQSGLKVALLEKSSFPRDKTCGDALSLDIVNQLPMLSPQILGEFEALMTKIPTYGVKIISPKGYAVELPFHKNGEKKCAYICERFVFDNFLFEQLIKDPSIEIFQQTIVTNIIFETEKVVVETDKGNFFSKIVLGADGAYSIVNKKTKTISVDKEHYSAGLRQYFENVTGFHPDNFIELHFFPELLPGYLWIFPLPNGKANVGLGVLSSSVSAKKMNLTEIFHKLIYHHPTLKSRFENAKALESVKGFGLPLGSKKRKLSGNRFLLLGDAASLIDPFSGEGIGNAIRSGRVAADIVKKAVSENNFSEKFLSQYDKELYSRVWNEFRVSKQLQNLSKRAWFFDFIVKRTNQSIHLRNFLMDALENVHKKKILTGPKFLYHLLFK
jgi:geranylgeranyl reductase family protein